MSEHDALVVPKLLLFDIISVPARTVGRERQFTLELYQAEVVWKMMIGY